MDSKHTRAMAIFHTTNPNLLADSVLRYWGETPHSHLANKFVFTKTTPTAEELRAIRFTAAVSPAPTVYLAACFELLPASI